MEVTTERAENRQLKMDELGKPLPPCKACGGEGRFDGYDAAWLWIECTDCGKETRGTYTAEEAYAHWCNGNLVDSTA